MALASSGIMSIGGTTTNRSINLELGLAQNANSGLNQINFRTLAGVLSGPISMDDFYGKSASTCTRYDSSSVNGKSAGDACKMEVTKQYYHDGDDPNPTTGDFVYSNSGCSIALGNGWYRLSNNTYIQVSSGRVQAYGACGK
tara:strand:+ start:9585 stop:10010 length:426 start_codon:yes stop_codon:yes gene_type:complete